MKSLGLISQPLCDAPERSLRTRFSPWITVFILMPSAIDARSRVTSGSFRRTLNKCASFELARPYHFSRPYPFHQIAFAVSRNLDGRFNPWVPFVVVSFGRTWIGTWFQAGQREHTSKEFLALLGRHRVQHCRMTSPRSLSAFLRPRLQKRRN